MSTERIVNSFGPGPGLQRDLDEIDEADRLAQSIVNEAVDSISNHGTQIPQAKAELAKSAEVIKKMADNSTFQAEAAKLGMDPAELDKIIDNAAVELGMAAARAFNGEVDVKAVIDNIITETGWNGENPIREMTAEEKLSNEIAALRASVIKTFKHMGIDTRKFFGA